MSQTKTQLVEGLSLNTSAPATALQIDASGNVNLDSNTLYVDATNNRVGMGTSSPARNLVVNGGASEGVIQITNDTSGTTAANGFELIHFTNGETQLLNRENGAMVFSTNDTQRMRITSAGNVGIGTTSPTSTLEVGSGNIELGGGNNTALTWSSDVSSHYLKFTTALNGLTLNGYGGLAFETFGANERMRIDSSGRLLVGTSSARTNIAGGTQGVLIEGSSSTNSQNRFTEHVFNANNAEGPYLGLAKSRSTSIGGNTIVQNGDYLGGIYFHGNDGSDFKQSAKIEAQVDGTPGTNDMPGRIVFSTTPDGDFIPVERMRISANGNIRLDPNANGITIYNFSTGAGTSAVKYNYNTGALTYDTSNRYVKDNIIDCPYGIAEIKQLQPRKYFRTDDQIDEIGFIADEVSEVMPEFVSMGVKSIATKNPEDTEIVPLAVNYEKMTAVLTAALQEAIAKIESLEAKVVALEGA